MKQGPKGSAAAISRFCFVSTNKRGQSQISCQRTGTTTAVKVNRKTIEGNRFDELANAARGNFTGYLPSGIRLKNGTLSAGRVNKKQVHSLVTSQLNSSSQHRDASG